MLSHHGLDGTHHSWEIPLILRFVLFVVYTSNYLEGEKEGPVEIHIFVGHDYQQMSRHSLISIQLLYNEDYTYVYMFLL